MSDFVRNRTFKYAKGVTNRWSPFLNGLYPFCSVIFCFVLTDGSFPCCDYKAGSSLISGWNSFPAITSFTRRVSGLLWEQGAKFYLCAHTRVCGRSPFPQGYIITWIIKPGQPEKEEGNSKEFQEDLWLNHAGFEKFLLHTHSHTHTFRR